jgi:hypothetical protein
MVYVCKKEDDFLEDKPRWFVDLTNGERIFMDDDRPGVQPPQAWTRLGLYLKETGADIVDMYLQFRSHFEHPLPSNALGYFFCNAALANLADGVTISMFLVGFFDGDQIQTQCWRVPELLQEWVETRSPKSLKHKDWLILKQGMRINGWDT